MNKIESCKSCQSCNPVQHYSTAAYCAGFSLAFSTHSSQQTVISFPATVTLIPPSLIAQSQTGHLLVFMSLSPLKMKNVNGDKLTTIAESRLPESCSFANFGGWPTKLTPEGVGKVTVTRKTQLKGNFSYILGALSEPFQRRA